MHELTSGLLRARFRHYDPARAAVLFHPDQPEDGTHSVRGQGKFPAVKMATDTWWYPDRERRPVNQQDAPMKSQAPAGAKPIQIDDQSARAVVLVEGEGHAVALRSIGWTGIVIAGGVKTLLTNSPAAREQRRQRFAGRDVWVWFDFDAPGLEAAPVVAQQAMDAGANRVAVIGRPGDWEEGQDIEDWLGGFATPGLAHGALCQVLGAAQWLSRNQLAEAQGEAKDNGPEVAIESLVPVGEGQPEAFLVTVYDEETGRIQLAVMGPAAKSEAPAPQHRHSVQHDAPKPEGPNLARGWQILDEWAWEGRRFVPDSSPEMMTMVRDHILVLPAPPAPYGTSEALWVDVRSYFQRWLAVARPEDYEVLTAYVMLTYRIFDEASFEHCPYLRVHGPPGSGKTQALKLLRRLCWRTFCGQTTQNNLHRFMDYYRSVTLICDEFHLEGKAAERRAEMIDVLNLGSERSGTLIRCDSTRDGRIIPRLYRLFGPKVFAGYGSDEHEALARRTVAIDMAGVDVPKEMEQLVASEALGKEAYILRQRLLDWRMAKRDIGRADSGGELARQLLDRASRDIAQNVWPLLAMVPSGLPDAVESIMKVAEGRKAATQQSRQISPEAVVLDAVHEAAKRHWYRGKTFIPTQEIEDQLTATGRPALLPPVPQTLAKLGFKTTRLRHDRGQNPVRGWLIDGGAVASAVFARYGIAWPPDVPSEGESAL